MTYTATQAGEWPAGIYWTPGEIRTLPDGYPAPGEPPAWLLDEVGAELRADAPAPKGKAKK